MIQQIIFTIIQITLNQAQKKMKNKKYFWLVGTIMLMYLNLVQAQSTGLETWAASDSTYQAWVQRYTGPGNLHDNATAIAVDNQGNIYVTGWSSETPVYPNEYDYDYTTIKYNPEGVVQWVQRYDGLGAWGDDKATAIAVDDEGNVYVTGRSQGTYLDYEYATIKYNTDGDRQWVQRHAGSYHNRAIAIAVDSQGNVYVTGRSWGMGSEDYATIKYSAHGELQWVRRYNGPANGDDYAWAIAVDDAGNVYVTGQSTGSDNAWDYATVKYDTDGVEQWVARYKGPGSEFDVARAIAVDNSRNVYVTGYSVGLGTGRDFATIKYNTNGVEQWVARYNGPDNKTDEANDLVVDNDGNVYVTGYSGFGTGTFYDFATTKYNTDGNELWVSRYRGPANWDVARAIAIDNFGNVYVTGYSYGTGTEQDYLTVAYDNNGTDLWAIRYNGPGNLDDVANAIAVDHSGNVYVTGRSVGVGTPLFGDDYATVKYIQTTVGTNNRMPVSQHLTLQNFPNPFSSETIITWQSDAGGHATMAVYDMFGRKVKTLIDSYQESGAHSLVYQPANLRSGIYILTLQTGSNSSSIKMIVTGKQALKQIAKIPDNNSMTQNRLQIGRNLEK